MAIDEDFVKQFEEQIVVLENMKQAVQDASTEQKDGSSDFRTENL